MISSEEEIVKTVARTYEAVVGRELVISGGPMSDLYLLNLYSRMPSLSFGIAGWSRRGGAHQPNEYVSISGLVTFTKVTALVMMDWCGYAEIP